MKFVLFFLHFISPLSSSATVKESLSTPVGVFLGTSSQESQNVTVFRNVPYAAPLERFKAPKPAAPAPGAILNNPDNLAMSAQMSNYVSGLPPEQLGVPVGDEHSAVMHVYKPNNITEEEQQLPVFVWVHGGSNKAGSIDDEVYEAGKFANENRCIVVSVQYRLGPFGAFYNKALNDGDTKNSSGNYVTLDLIRALEWIQNNIHFFSGDNKRVTVGGESAGAINVWGLMLSPLAKGLFHRVYLMSGLPNLYPAQLAKLQSDKIIKKSLVLKGRAKNYSEAKSILKSMNQQEVLDYLYDLETDDLIHAGFDDMVQFQHIADGHVLPKTGIMGVGGALDWLTLLSNLRNIDVVIGGTGNEASLFALLPALQSIDPSFTAKDLFSLDEKDELLKRFIGSDSYREFKTILLGSIQL